MDQQGELPAGTWILGQFRILRLLGRGGMASVYLAEQPSIERHVAIKVLSRLGPGEDSGERFRQEARAASRLAHPNIISVYNFGQLANNAMFIAMEYVPGPTVEQLRRGGRVEPALATDIVRQCATALRFAHESGVVHRDIKPSNVMLRRVLDRWHVMVLDFGLARTPEDPSLTQPGAMLGTPQYMSPEQCAGLPSGPESDQYSLGLVYYELLTGRAVVEGKTAFDCLKAHLEIEPPPPSRVVGRNDWDALDAVVLRMLAKRPGDRYSDAQLSAKLDELAGAIGAPAAIDVATDAPTLSVEEIALGDVTIVEAPSGSFDRGPWQSALAEAGFRGDAKSTASRVPEPTSSGVTRANTSPRSRVRLAPRGGGRALSCVESSVAPAEARALVDAGEALFVGEGPPDAAVLRMALRWLAGTSEPGLDAVLRSGWSSAVELKIECAGDRASYVDRLAADVEVLRPRPKRAVVELAQEMISNAVFHAPVEGGQRLYSRLRRDQELRLASHQQPLLRWARSDVWFAVSVRDPFGSLAAGEAAERIVAAARTPDLERVAGSAGMGLEIMARAATHLAILVTPGRSTEVLGFVALDPTARHRRSLLALTRDDARPVKLGRRLEARIEASPTQTRVRLSGEIDESCDLRALYGEGARKLPVIVELAGVERINSGGLRAWLEAARASAAAELTLTRCSMALVSQINLVTFFAERHHVESVMAPYACTACSASSIEEVAVADMKGYEPPARRCSACGAPLAFDDLPEDYFAFVEWHRTPHRGASR